MRENPWYLSVRMVLLVTVVLPPLGLVLLWMRRGPGIVKKAFGSLGAVVLAVAYLVVFFGLRLQLDGGVMPRYLTFVRPEAQAEAIERHREQQQRTLPVEKPVVPPDATETREETSPAVEPAAAEPGPPAAGSAYWSEYRGRRRDGHYDQMPVLTEWPATGLPLAWKQPVGGGYASFALAHGCAFTIEQRRDREVVAAYDMRSGREFWTHSWPALFQETLGGNGPRATPTWHEGRVYALGATGFFRCLEHRTGKVIWARNIIEDAGAGNLTWGMAASPLVVDDKVIVLPGGGDGKSVAAYDRMTGEIAWTSLSDKQAYVSPMLVTLAGKRQLLVVSSRRAMGLTVEDGTLLWEFPWKTSNDTNSAQPVVVDDRRFVISSGYGRGAALVEISLSDGRFDARAVWENVHLKTRFNSSVLHEGYLYGLDEGILVCIDAATGERRWKGGRYGYGQVLLASGHLFITSEDGDIVLVKATPEEHREVASFPALNGRTWNVPAIADGYLLVRNAVEMAAYRISP
ncbi:MAG: PQQ-binding-like beta-propeller repeat protein [Acidobacteriota bacterium]